MADVTDILNNDDERLSDEELLRYLQQELSERDKHEVEKKLVNDPFERDAAEGLSGIKHKDLHEHVQQLNKHLHQQLAAKKHKNEKRKIKEIPLLLLAVLLILFICIVSYFVIHLQQKKQENKQPSKEQTITSITR